MFYCYHDGNHYYPQALSKKLKSMCPGGGLKIIFEGSLVKMTGQIHFSSDILLFWPVK